jgi:3-hydroxyisobutyrate dehydrogenase-like beta-hydroxyacid dehydrogenase
MPFDNLSSAPALNSLIAHQQEALNLSDAALAEALGYDSPAVMDLINTGKMRLPMTKAHILAEVLEMDPGEVMYLLLRDTSPEMLASIEQCLAPLALTRTEARIICKLREAADGRTTTPMFLDGAAIVGIVFAQ